MNKRIILIAALSFIMLAGASLSVIIAQQNATPEMGSFTELTLELSSTKNRFVRLEPIPVTFTLSNQTEKEIRGHASLSLSSLYLDLYIQHNSGEMQKIDGLTKESRYFGVTSSNIRQGERFRRRHLLSLNLDNLFPETGVYRLQVVFQDDSLKEMIKSNIIDINIVEPTGVDLEAFNYLSQVDTSDFFEGVTNSSPEKAVEFVARFGDSSYGPYAIYQLGQFHFLKGDYPEAMRLLGKLAGQSDFVFSDQVLDYLNKSKDKPKSNR
ncbi:MAG: tetratricopeptide repeat protein [Pyrinomonadaceae bacterium]